MHKKYSTEALTAIAVEAALAGGREILAVYARADFGVRLKDDHSPLTEADLQSNRVILSLLEQTGIPVMSEESRMVSYEERSNWDALWVVDPLDGTKEFVKRNGEFTVNIALVRGGKPVLGVVLVPVRGWLYVGYEGVAEKWSDEEWSTHPQKTWTGKKQRLPLIQTQKTILVASISHPNGAIARFEAVLKQHCAGVELRGVGSSVKLCLLAEGEATVYPRFGDTMEWDTAAGQAVLEASGGKLWQIPNFEPLRYNRREVRNPYFLAVSAQANGALMQQCAFEVLNDEPGEIRLAGV